jgi:hypothetical protein
MNNENEVLMRNAIEFTDFWWYVTNTTLINELTEDQVRRLWLLLNFAWDHKWPNIMEDGNE